MKALIALIPLVAILLVSGCTTMPFAPTTTTGNGVVIEAFEPDFKDVYSGEPVQLNIKLRNMGSGEAAGITAEIQGIDTDDWQLEDGCEPDVFNLLPPDPARGTSGGVKTCLWNLVAPKLPAGLPTTYNPIVRVDYGYESATVKSITLMPIAEARRLQNLGQQFPAETVSSTSGPIKFDITTKGPIRVIDSNNMEFPLEIQISNIGGGTVYPLLGSSTSSDDWNKLEYEVTLPSSMSSSECSGSKTLTLFKGQTNTITCPVKITSVPETPIQVQVTVRSDYSYFIDKSTSIKVTGTAGSGF